MSRRAVLASLVGRLEDGLLVTMVAILLAISFGQILLRNLFDISLIWIDPLARHLVMWAGFFGALVAAREGKHIRIDALLRLLSPRRRIWAQLIGDTVSTAVCGFLASVAYDFVADERRYGATGLLDLPTWILQLVFPLCFGLMACRYAVRVAERVLAIARSETVS